jgi:hypothetical protein
MIVSNEVLDSLTFGKVGGQFNRHMVALQGLRDAVSGLHSGFSFKVWEGISMDGDKGFRLMLTRH